MCVCHCVCLFVCVCICVCGVQSALGTGLRAQPASRDSIHQELMETQKGAHNNLAAPVKQ